MTHHAVNPFYDRQLDDQEYDQKGGRTDHATIVRFTLRTEVHEPVILDLGCGDGAVAAALAAANISWRRYMGVDCNPRLLQKFRDRSLPNIDLHELDATAPQLQSSSFDIVISTFVLEHFNEVTGEQHINYAVNAATVAVILAAPLVLSSDFVSDLGLRGPAGAQTRKWNWGEIAARRRFHKAGMHKLDFEAYWNSNGTIHEYYLLARRADYSQVGNLENTTSLLSLF